jgi:hypothetical protein
MIAPYYVEDDDGNRIYGERRRDPFYVEAGRLIGPEPPELAGDGPGRAQNAEDGDEAEGAPDLLGPQFGRIKAGGEGGIRTLDGV